MKDFAETHMRAHFGIDLIHQDNFSPDSIDLIEKQAIAILRDLRNRKWRAPWAAEDLAERLRKSRISRIALWLEAEDFQSPLLLVHPKGFVAQIVPLQRPSYETRKLTA